jgi:glucosamine-6-phosphate deaminase
MRTDLSSHIKLDKVSKRYYRPESELELASLTRCEKVYTKIVESEHEGALDAALDIADIIKSCVKEKGRCVIGFGAGKSALSVYDELVNLYFADKVSFANVVAFNISELGLGVISKDGQSTIDRLHKRLFNKVDIDKSNIYTFSNEATKENVHKLCKLYESDIDEMGGLDLVVCELTKSCSIALNEPGSSMNSMCRLMLLGNDSRTRVADSYQCENAPLTAVTLGIANLLAARHLLCVAWGEDSADSVYTTVEGRMSDLAPSTFMQMHHNVKVVVDLEAATKLTRICFPWKVTSCEWTDKLIRRALVWLSKTTKKPILKLTNKDYNDNGLSELVAVYGSAYNVNIRIFNDLQHTITGWPGGKPNADDSHRPERALPYPKRVLAFGPHPDDVVVAMGGTLKRLIEQGHEVHVAIQTSGDIAVNDEDLDRYILLLDSIGEHFGINGDNYHAMNSAIREFLKHKNQGDPDSPDVRYVKGRILECEAYEALNFVGVKRENMHELEMPFYTQHPLGRGKVTDADAQIILDMIKQIQPHQIFFADDLADPFGTHVRATNAVLAAIDELKDEPFMRDCRIWMYRGAWGVWDIDDIEMAVPMSPEEFRNKRDAILRYQSQIGDAPFREGEDGYMSWQRSIDRNKSIAILYSALGLASYEAIEAFVQYHPVQ